MANAPHYSKVRGSNPTSFQNSNATSKQSPISKPLQFVKPLPSKGKNPTPFYVCKMSELHTVLAQA